MTTDARETLAQMMTGRDRIFTLTQYSPSRTSTMALTRVFVASAADDLTEITTMVAAAMGETVRETAYGRGIGNGGGGYSRGEHVRHGIAHIIGRDPYDLGLTEL